MIEYSLKLDSNPESPARARRLRPRLLAHGLRGRDGCRTIFDIAPALLSPMTPEELRAKML